MMMSAPARRMAKRLSKVTVRSSTHPLAAAALTIYDMAKAAEKTMRIGNIRLVEKHGGRSGDVVNE